MRVPITFIIAFVLFSTPFVAESGGLWDRTDVKVGKRPLCVFKDPEISNKYHVICGGFDADFDGEYEPEQGEYHATWYTYDLGSSDAALFKTFEWEMQVQNILRAIIHDGALYMPVGKNFRAYDLSSGDAIYDETGEADFIAVTFGQDKSYRTIRKYAEDGFTLEENYVEVLDGELGEELYQIPGGDFLQETIEIVQEDRTVLGVLNEGNYGSKDSFLTFWEIGETEATRIGEIFLGDAGNKLEYGNRTRGKIVAVSNGSHDVRIIDAETLEVLDSAKTPSESWDGPRESASEFIALTGSANLYGIFVSTFETDGEGDPTIMRFDPADLETPPDFIDAKGKTEGILIDGRYLLACNIYKAGTYDPEEYLSIFESINSVYEKPADYFRLGPIPATSTLSITCAEKLIGDYAIDIFNYSGRRVYSSRFIASPGAVETIDLANLPSGSYVLRLNDGKKYISQSFTIER